MGGAPRNLATISGRYVQAGTGALILGVSPAAIDQLRVLSATSLSDTFATLG